MAHHSAGFHPFLTFLFIAMGLLAGAAGAQPAADQSGLRLIGTVESPPFTGAVLGDSSGIQTFYRLHEQLPDGSQIVGVGRFSIILKHADGSRYELFIGHGTSASAPLASPPPPSLAPAVPKAGGTQNSGQTPEDRRRRGRTRPVEPEEE